MPLCMRFVRAFRYFSRLISILFSIERKWAYGQFCSKLYYLYRIVKQILKIFGHLAGNFHFFDQNENYYRYISGYSTF